MRLLLAVTLVLLTLGWPAAAQAASVGRQDDPRLAAFVFVASAGEANDVRISPVDGGRSLRVEDRGAPLRVSGTCVRVDASTATCPNGSPQVLTVMLGDGDDRFAVDGRPSLGEVLGGPGNDVLVGGSGPDNLVGNPGRDVLKGSGGDDLLFGDGPFDLGAGEVDVMDGGAGTDSAAYGARRVPVRVDLAAPGGTEDVLRGIESLGGGYGPDRLEGDAGPNHLIGVGGEDRIDGRGGDDVLSGVGDLRGGRGDDAIESQGGTVSCGPGLDRVEPVGGSYFSQERFRPARPPRLARDCELLTVTRFIFRAGAPLRLDLRKRRSGRYVLRCPARPVRRCRGSLRAGRATARFAVRPGERRALRAGAGRRLTLTVGPERVDFVLD